MTKIDIFHDLDYLHKVRNNHLNPLIRRVEDEIVPLIKDLETEIHETVRDVTLDETTKIITVDKGQGGHRTIDLNTVLPEFKGIGVQDQTGSGPSAGIKLIQFPDATINILPSGESATVGFKWVDIFDHNQKWPEAVVGGAVSHLKSIVFTGDPSAVKTDGNNVTLKIPKLDPVMVTIPDKGGAYINPRPITSIEVAGEVSNTAIVDEKLVLNLSSGGGGGTVTNQNFKGFFESLGDLESKVTDPLHGKSFAYVKDSTLGGGYYTAYFYVNSNWTELTQDPALTYFAPGVATNQGVFSIKPSEKITLDSNGQLNLDGLSTPQLPQYFVGFFDTLEQLKAEVPNPVVHQTHAYVKGPSGRGWLNYRADRQGSASLWSIVAPLGSFSFVDEKAASFTQVFGIKKSDAWELDSQGLLTMKGGSGPGPGGALSVGISGNDGQLEVHDVTSMSFNKGKSFAEFTGSNKDHVLLDHPQRVINYNSTFEQGHNHRDYEGNIFYDETSRAWMGWGIPKDAGAVDNKWTRIAHPKMSDEVKDLSRRLPAKSASITPGLIGDNPMWDHNGVTFLDVGSSGLPEEIRSICGGYVTTSVQDKDTSGVTIPQYRIQTLTADRDEGGTWVRRFIATGSAGSAVSWSKWVRTSFSNKDIDKHSKDPNCHKDVIKFHRVATLTGVYQNLHNQTMDGLTGQIRVNDYHLLADNYSHAHILEDYNTVPYDNGFTCGGVLEFSGYNGGAKPKVPVGKWTVLLRIQRNGSQVWEKLKEWYYTHTTDQGPYPSIEFKVEERLALELNHGDKLSLHIMFDNPVALKNQHPDLYIVPLRSYLYMQDKYTKTGEQIGANQRRFYGALDVNGALGVKIHHATPNDPASSIRMYGSRIVRETKDMNIQL